MTAHSRDNTHQYSPLLEVSNLAFSYDGPRSSGPILSDISLSLASGEVLALLGSSGCGKSTLLNLISGIEEACNGSVRINGAEMVGLDDRSRTLVRRRQIGFIYQFFNLVPTLTALENIALVPELNGYSATGSRDLAMASLVSVELESCAHQYPDQLSGGEQQRVAIARALVHGPSLVLADEPTGNLDARSGRRVMALLHQLVATHGAGMILVTHSRDVAAGADRIVQLQDGRLQEGNHSSDDAEEGSNSAW